MIDASYIKLHQHGAGAKGGHLKQEIGRSRGGLTTNINAVVDALGNTAYVCLVAMFMTSSQPMA